jgi:N-acyl-L-homoserine lactone synthetase
MAKDVLESLGGDDKKFARMSGLKRKLFEVLVEKVLEQTAMHQRAHPISGRGKKPTISIANKLLLMLMYYQNYHTYLTISEMFEVSEGYANKIVYRMSKLVIKALPLGRKRKIGSEEIKAVLIDASEQRIERPVRKQRQYYSGKKSSHYQSTTGGR